MPWPWEREQQRPPLADRLEDALARLDRGLADLRAEVDRLRALRQAKEQGPCQTS